MTPNSMDRVSAAGAFAKPVCTLSGLACAISLFFLIFVPASRSFVLFLFVLIAAGIFVFSRITMKKLSAQEEKFIETINRKENLTLNPDFRLGGHGREFIVFDKKNRKLAVCESFTGKYHVHGFNHVLRWYTDATSTTSNSIGMGGASVPGSGGMQGPTSQEVTHVTGFHLAMEVADEYRPVLKFYMTEREANEWCARLSAILNG